MMETRHLERALQILIQQHYLTLATVCEDGSPWNTPVSANVDGDICFTWGSSLANQHSQNLERDSRAFAVLFDSSAPEGSGEGLYFRGKVVILDTANGDITLFKLIPEQIWINDEAKNDDGTYKHDIRIEIPIEELRKEIQAVQQ